MFTNDSNLQVKNKIIILYIIDTFKIAVSNNFLTEFIMKQDLMDYFVFQQYLTELIDNKLLELADNDNKSYYLITENGRNTLSLFADNINSFTRQTIIDGVAQKKSEIKKEKQVFADYRKITDNDYRVKLEVKEGEISLINLEVSMISNKHAKNACEAWKKDATGIYSSILNKLIIEE